MPPEEQKRRNQVLRERLRRYDVNRWADDFIQALLSSQKMEAAWRARRFEGRPYSRTLQRYAAAGRRVLFLDYDGTLRPFAPAPRLASPDKELLELLSDLAGDPRNEVVIVSGRPRQDLEEWFGQLPVGLVAEHGVWLRHHGGEWRLLKPMNGDWKERVRTILQLYVDRLPGALLGEKDYSLAWHYRRADPDQASVRAKELLDDLADYTRNVDVQVLEGNKVVELRVSGANKGAAATQWLEGQTPEFILAVGDDWTDEDLFRALPPEAVSVRVGLANTAAHYYVDGHMAVRHALRELINAGREPTAALEAAEEQTPAAPALS
jgi:trehalose 6-phosphate synthase/phosphatase